MKYKYIFTLLFLFMVSFPAFAQGEKTYGSVKVKVLDTLSKEPISFATIFLSKDGDVQGAKYSTTDAQGHGVINNVEAGKYILTAEMMGYLPKRVSVSVKEGINDIGTIYMSEDVTTLEQAVVTAVGNPIVVKKDTIEYSAASFKTTENDMLEDLLKKMPGFDVDASGAITSNGKTINKVMIQGKEFFLDDPQLASKNIPASLINKVRVLEKKSEQAEFTGIDDGEEETVLDLTIKPGFMDSWFGNFSGGGGMDISSADHGARFQAAGMAGRFTDDSQFSIIANGNNTNNRGFNDMTSSMMGGMRQYGGRGGFGGGGYGGSSGITTSWMGGVNGNWYLGGDKDRELGGNAMYNGSINDVQQRSHRTTFLDSTQSLITANNSVSANFNDGLRAGINFDYKFNDKTSLMFRPYFRYGTSRFDETSDYTTDNTEFGKVNDGQSESSGNGTTWTTGGRAMLRQRIGLTPGRTFSLFINYSISNNSLSGDNKSLTRTFAENILKDSTIIDQHYDRKENSYSVSANMTYTEPLGRNFFMQASYRFGWNQSLSEKLTYNNPTQELDIAYSNRMENTFLNHRMQLSFMKQEDKYNVQIGVNAQPATTYTTASLGVVRDTSYTVWNFAPSARFDYHFSDNNFLRINYNGRTNQPSINQLMPVPDNSNPLYVSLGNTSLNPEFSHNLWADYRYTDMKTFSTYNLRANFSYTKDDIINASWYNSSGVQYTVPINSARPTFNGSLMLMINSQIAKSKFSIMSYTRGSVTSNLTYTGSDTTATSLEEIRGSLIGGRTTSLSLTENLTFVYRNDFIETRLGGRVTYKNAWYEISSQKKAQTWDNVVFAEVNATLPWGMEIGTDARYNFYYGYDAGYGDPMLRWNAEISQSFLKKKLTLVFKVYDILNQSKNNYRTTTDNYVEDVYNNTLGQYFMLSLTYRFGNFGQMMGGGGMGRGHRR